MRKLVIGLMLVVLLVGCVVPKEIRIGATDQPTLSPCMGNIVGDYDITFGPGPTVTYLYCVYSTNRDTLIKSVDEDYDKYYKLEEPRENYLVLELIDSSQGIYYKEVYATKEDVPHGNIYLGDCRWLIYYEQNGGYMPVTRKMESKP